MNQIQRPSNISHGCGCGMENGSDNMCVSGACGCPTGSLGLTDRPLGMVYAPCQKFTALYDPEVAISRGTLFKELDLPFEGDTIAKSSRGCR